MEVKISTLGINGEGVTRIPSGDGREKVCFVSYALPNEVVDITIVLERSKFSIGKLNKVISESVDRKTPRCPYFSICGGCDLQHYDSHKQRLFKKEKVSNALRKVVSIDKIRDTNYCNEYGYRNKMVFAFREEYGSLKLGMFEGSSRRIVEIDKCILTSENINRVYAVSKEYFLKSKFTGYNDSTKSGDLKYLVIRDCNDSMLVSVVADKRLDLEDYYKVLSSNFNNIGLSLIISDSDNEILSGKYIHLYGLESLSLNEFGVEYNLNNLGFLQVNTPMKERLYSRVLENIDSSSTVIDAYSGAGLLSAIISKKCNKVIGIEINASASNSAKELSKRNNIDNITFYTDDVASKLGLVLKGNEPRTIVLDPPRSGCEGKVIKTILEAKKSVEKVIYISCNPATLGRDLEILSQNFEVEMVEPFDLFPQTKHIETLVILKTK